MFNIARFATAVNFDLSAVAPEADDFRPTAGPDYIPTAEEEAEAAELLNGDYEPTDAEWEEMAEDAAAMDRVYLGCYAF
jgi:hypothetical protein